MWVSKSCADECTPVCAFMHLLHTVLDHSDSQVIYLQAFLSSWNVSSWSMEMTST